MDNLYPEKPLKALKFSDSQRSISPFFASLTMAFHRRCSDVDDALFDALQIIGDRRLKICRYLESTVV